MTCDISKIIEKLYNAIDPVIKGNAASINKLQDGNFSVKWGEQYRIKSKQQAIRAAEQKITAANIAADNAGFDVTTFGPYLKIEEQPKQIVIKKLNPIKLVKALEIRNKASEEQKPISLSEDDNNIFNLAETESISEIDKDGLIAKAKQIAEDKLTGMNRDLFKSNPEEFLKFVAEQFYGVANGKMSDIASPTDSILQYYGQELVDVALDYFPLNELLNQENLPPIEPSC